MKTLTRIILALVVAVVVFWLIRFGGWVGSLTTQRTELYFTLNHIGAWIGAGIAAIATFVTSD